jgi:hypothetical protein
MGMMDRRSFTRVPFRSEAILKAGGSTIDGFIENISLSGACIKVHEKLQVDQDLEIEIFLAEPASDLSVNLGGSVVWSSPEEIGVRFTGMYLDVYERIRDMIAGSVADKQTVLQEFLDYMSLKPRASKPA